jgi:quinoprotein glucose dehydrogenase
MQGLPEEELIDFTPELRTEALEILEDYVWGPFFNPPLHRDNDLGKKGSLWCPGDVGGTNIDGTPVADPTTGIMYITSQKGCSSRVMITGAERETEHPDVIPTGTTLTDFAVGDGNRVNVRGLQIFKPPYSKITAIDMNTGDHLWSKPVGDTPDRVLNHPDLQGLDIPKTGSGRQAAMLATPDILIHSANGSDGTPYVRARDKATGDVLGEVEVPGSIRYGMMTYMHEGVQHLVINQVGGLVALTLP